MRITIGLIMDLDLPLDSTEMVQKKDAEYKKAKKEVELLEKKYGYTSRMVASVALSPYCSKYDEVVFRSIKKQDRYKWWKALRIIVSASFRYHFLLASGLLLDFNQEYDDNYDIG